MPVRLLPCLALLALAVGLMAEPTPVVQAQQPGTGPALILRLRSIDSLQADAKYLVKQAGQEEAAKQIDELLKLYVQGSGIDTKKPLGAYASIDAQDPSQSPAVLLVPITDEKSFLKKLDGFGLQVKPEGGIHTIAGVVGGQDAYMRFANSYAYISNQKSAVTNPKTLPGPGTIFDANDKAAISFALRPGQVPKPIKDLIHQTLDQVLAAAKDQAPPNTTPAQQKLLETSLQDTIAQLKSIVDDGQELALRFDVDSKAAELYADLVLTGRPGSKLAAAIKSYETKSVFGSALGTDSALNLLVNTSLSDTSKKAFGAVIDEGIEAALAQAKPADRAVAEKFLKVLAPTLKAGEFDLALTMRGPGKGDKYSVLAGMKVKNGLEIDKALRDIVKSLKPEEQARIKFDAEKIGYVNAHRLDIGKDVDAKGQALFGDGPMYVAFRADAAYFAAGENGLAVLKEAVNAKPGAAPAFQAEIAVSRFAAALAQEDKDFVKAAQLAFPQPGKGNDKVRLSVEGGAALRLRFTMKGDVLRFFTELAKLKAGI